MHKRLALFITTLLLFFGISVVNPVFAADIRSGEDLTISETEQNLSDMYLFGGSVRVNAPVENDVVAAGGNIDINEEVTGSVIVAGGNINIRSKVGNTVRAAGGNVRIDGEITRDLVVAGGNVVVNKNAKINGDVIFNGGTLTLDGPVGGKVIANGGNITINSQIQKDVSGTVETLRLGPQANIAGNLSYKSPQRAQIAGGAVVQGKSSYTPVEKPKDQTKEFVTASTIYKLVADIIISVLLIYFFGRALLTVITRMVKEPVQSGAVGFAFFFVFPIFAALALILFWLGIAAFFVYAVLFIISLYLVKIFLGWWVLTWWQRRNNKVYQLDWKAGILGPILLFIIALIPFIGWLAAAIIFLIAMGALVWQLTQLMKGQKVLPQKAAVKKK